MSVATKNEPTDPHRVNRFDLRADEEQAMTADQVMAARGYERKPGGGWTLKPAGIIT